MKQEPLPNGSTIGILGGGQLGMMMAEAAAKLGYKTHIYCPQEDCPAARVAAYHTIADYTDNGALRTFAEAVDVVTLEFENIPLEAAKTVEQYGTLHPSSQVLEICQHRIKEKQFINDCGIQTAPFLGAATQQEAMAALEQLGTPAIMKTCTMGYDGKGQAKVESFDAIAPAWSALASDDVIVEGFVPFEKEASVIAARNGAGDVICYPLVENIHKNHILHQTIAPANLPEEVAAKAEAIATTLAQKLELIGIMAVELFVCGDELVVNELAPRPHNSGHWSMDACEVSQFEQVIRAVTGLPLKAPVQHSAAVMTNLIGDDVLQCDATALGPDYFVHVYGKIEVKPGRKMGHVTKLIPANEMPQCVGGKS